MTLEDFLNQEFLFKMMVTSMLVTKCVGSKFEILVTNIIILQLPVQTVAIIMSPI